ncbi:PBSX family phage terminase large subunit [Lactobacillus crispatus]|jgi:phage terminase, large subunit, PBSX family|uniref:PBSX family phage terminase large subunit n=1 Tax=Lactobacillus crispatus TaxID=47770 RepID=UPI0001B2AE53|nr:PBSX family phage terminase large subunit [Lactobacillus crispatus]DAJ15635.1 MAG TPA: large terminase [Siphoviridae sp. ctBfm1]EEU27527.1 PBSX family phage terminase, large subunit [Lactobacillus crispatus MV-1A-US]MCT7823267.1 PBSX family phage terminase large subunit [Lactobacillus crispatus]MCZ3674399.1 PBSX family phage terminase large subunit [Lactobacillus crispatus]MCZ3682206.1 PBSX family phage terminase large subunit [Lactobacillus crispatus]
MWTTDKPYVVCKGGRGSFKSSVISLKLVTMMMFYIAMGKTVNVICIRENQQYLRDSVYNQILWAMSILGVESEFRTRVSPMVIQHIRTGSTFYFYGANDPMKLKSNIVGNVVAVWFEEFSNLKNVNVFDQSVPTFIRQKPDFVKDVKIFISYNPPRNPYAWVNEWVTQRETDPDYFVDSSTYLDDELGFTTKQQLDLIEKYKQNDPDYYRWLYLGEAVGLGTQVYNMKLFKVVDRIPDDEYITDIFYGMDTGFMVSATACVACAFTNKYNVYVLDTFYYDPTKYERKLSASEQAERVHDFINQITDKYGVLPCNQTIDSADGGIYTQYWQMYNVQWSKVRKLGEAEMIDRVQDLAAQGRLHVLKTPSNDIFLDEHKKYQWDPATVNSDHPRVIKEFDHSCDALKYGVLDNEQLLGLSA